MRKFVANTVVCVGVALFASSGAAESLHHSYWKRSAPDISEGQTIKCSGAVARSDMLALLEEAGWNFDKGIPDVDWSRQQAVIIAKDEDMRFRRLFRKDGKTILYYHIVKPKPPRQKSGVIVQYSRAPQRSVIVVSFDSLLETGSKFVCQYKER